MMVLLLRAGEGHGTLPPDLLTTTQDHHARFIGIRKVVSECR
jgi:hypothetical protein